MKKRLNVLVLFDLPTPPPADGNYAAQLNDDDWSRVKAILKALEELGHEGKPMGIFDDVLPLVTSLKNEPPDVVFNLVDSFCNDRRHEADLAGLLELLRIPYTGCPPQALSICRIKSFAKRILIPLGIRLPKALVFPVGVTNRPLSKLRYPLFVKPLTEEGSEGISQASFVETEEQCLARVRFLHENLNADAYVEEYIEGREIYASVIGNSRLTVLPFRELVFEGVPEGQPKIATFKAKWDEAFRSRWGIKNTFARPLPDAVSTEIDYVARTAYRSLGLRGCGRLDMRVTAAGEVFVLEVNSNPNLAPDDEIARSAAKAGMDYPQLIQKLLALALAEKE